MELNRECIKAIMLYLEDNIKVITNREQSSDVPPYEMQVVVYKDTITHIGRTFGEEVTWYTMEFLKNNNFFTLYNPKYPYSKLSIIDITPKGHDFLYNIKHQPKSE